MKETEDLIESEHSTGAVLVRAYGEFWNPSVVDWERSGELLGIDSQKRHVNVYEQRGIYALYNDYVPVYIGKADRQSIGYRLQAHRKSRRKEPRWDQFSWFGLKRINKDGKCSKGPLTSKFNVKTSELISTLEALLILVADPRLNSRREKLRNAIRVSQFLPKESLPNAEQQMKSIEEKLDFTISSIRTSKTN